MFCQCLGEDDVARKYIPVSLLTPEQLDERRQKERLKRRRLRAADPEAERARGRKLYAQNQKKYLRNKKAWRESNPEKTREIKQRYWKDNRAKYIVQMVRSEAKKKGVKFEISVEWVKQRLAPGICELSGLPFNLTNQSDRKNAPSIDRIMAGGDYVESNCRLILFGLNSILKHLDVPHAVARIHELRGA
jgi:hypothetical protein